MVTDKMIDAACEDAEVEIEPLYSSATITALQARVAEVEKERDEAREHIRKQAEDIMTLGALVYADENTTWKARAEAAEAALRRARPYVEMIVKDEFHDLGTEKTVLAQIDAALSNGGGNAE